MNTITKNPQDRSICLYFQVHQPMRLKKFRFFDIGADHYYYDDYLNKSIIKRVAEKSYLPANNIMLDLIKKYNGDFKVSYSLSGTVIQQLEDYAPEVIASFQELANTGCVEFLAESSAHSLSSLKNKNEFRRQVEQHSKKIEELFGQKPVSFRNTELIYSDEIGEMVHELGYNTMLIEGAKHILGWKSPNFVYKHPEVNNLNLLLRNYTLSDDIAFRFSNRDWSEWPLTSHKFADWLNAVDSDQPIVNLFMDYETFGEHQWDETGIFDFLRNFPEKALENTNFKFRTPKEIVALYDVADDIHVPNSMSWADEERDLTAWLGNDLQDDAHNTLYKVADIMSNCTDENLKQDWLNLQNSDHFYYMCTKWFSDGAVHEYFNPYDSPYDAYVNYMNVVSDFLIRIKAANIPTEGIELIKEEEPKKITVKKIEKKSTVANLKFEDLDTMSLSKAKSILKSVETKNIYSALIDADSDLKNFVFASLGKRVVTAIQKLEEANEKVLKKDVLASRKIIVEIMNK